MYRNTGAGREPLPPALLCMVCLLQAYTTTSDAEAVELTVVDARWQMVLDCLGAEPPLFSQGSLPVRTEVRTRSTFSVMRLLTALHGEEVVARLATILRRDRDLRSRGVDRHQCTLELDQV